MSWNALVKSPTCLNSERNKWGNERERESDRTFSCSCYFLTQFPPFSLSLFLSPNFSLSLPNWGKCKFTPSDLFSVATMQRGSERAHQQKGDREERRKKKAVTTRRGHAALSLSLTLSLFFSLSFAEYVGQTQQHVTVKERHKQCVGV